MKNFKFLNKALASAAFVVALGSCTNLEEVPLDGIITVAPGGAVNTAAFLQTAYNGLRDFQVQGQTFAMNEMSTDALAGPTREIGRAHV